MSKTHIADIFAKNRTQHEMVKFDPYDRKEFSKHFQNVYGLNTKQVECMWYAEWADACSGALPGSYPPPKNPKINYWHCDGLNIYNDRGEMYICVRGSINIIRKWKNAENPFYLLAAPMYEMSPCLGFYQFLIDKLIMPLYN